MITTTDVIAIVTPVEVSVLALTAWILRKLNQHDIALALLLNSVMPPNDKSLREIVNEIKLQNAAQSAAQGIQQ